MRQSNRDKSDDQHHSHHARPAQRVSTPVKVALHTHMQSAENARPGKAANTHLQPLRGQSAVEPGCLCVRQGCILCLQLHGAAGLSCLHLNDVNQLLRSAGTRIRPLLILQLTFASANLQACALVMSCRWDTVPAIVLCSMRLRASSLRSLSAVLCGSIGQMMQML